MAAPLKADAAPRPGEPSMEEILASIRKIISDEDGKAPAKPEPEPPPVQSQDDIDALMAGFEMDDVAEEIVSRPTPAEPDILELTEDMAVPQERPAEARPAAPPPPEPPRRAEPVLAAFSPSERLISSSTDQAISSAFGDLTHTILSQNARTLDDLVQDMLRPMLKTWLDDNLPPLVERLVRAEIERVSRARR